MSYERIKASNFAKSVANKIYNRIEDDLDHLKSVYICNIDLPANSSAAQQYQQKLVYDARSCNNFTAYAKDFTVNQIYENIILALKHNNIINEQDGENEYLYGNSLLAAIELMIKYIQCYVKKFSTRNPNSEKQTTLNFLCRKPDESSNIVSNINQNVSADVILDYDFGEVKRNNLNIIQKIPIQSLFGTLAKEINRQKRFFIRYSIYNK